MSEQSNHYPHKPPFKTLGKYLKTMRQKLQESLGETSGAVEIDVEKLDRYERGDEAPSEDILMLLISHFGLQDEEAVELWELAGYTREDMEAPEADRPHDQPDQVTRAMQVTLVALDNRVLHSTGVEIVADDTGSLVLNFLQPSINGQQPYVVSRIGMSADQAHQMLKALQTSLLHQKYAPKQKRLPAPEKSDDTDSRAS